MLIRIKNLSSKIINAADSFAYTFYFICVFIASDTNVKPNLASSQIHIRTQIITMPLMNLILFMN